MSSNLVEQPASSRKEGASIKNELRKFLDLYPNFHTLAQSDQVMRLIYYHTVDQEHETVSAAQLGNMFDMADLRSPRNLPNLLACLCGRSAKLVKSPAGFKLQRHVRQEIEAELVSSRNLPRVPRINGTGPFDFQYRVVMDAKVSVLFDEVKNCYATGCWNACGILIRIIVERTLDAADPAIKARSGLKDKINFAAGCATLFSKSIRDGLRELHAAKLVGDIVAHHSTIILDKSDVDIVLPAFRMLLKEVSK